MATLIRIGLGPTPKDVSPEHHNGAVYVSSEIYYIHILPISNVDVPLL